ncbi:uncharacterized protein LOC114973655 [Acropora millepora]|uniref:uncharacterized protein LOC114973655 n=1 Tax=Acropora millepora TaxID=45264 RepID=UPI001CF4544F|nr:uncharacterized protein LOC114973655 [Acropora millepora]
MLGFINMEITIKLRCLGTTVLVRRSRNSNPLDLYPSACEQSNRYSKLRWVLSRGENGLCDGERFCNPSDSPCSANIIISLTVMVTTELLAAMMMSILATPPLLFLVRFPLQS